MVAGIATILSGRLDDLVGPRKVILGSLGILLVAGMLVFFLAPAMYGLFIWVGKSVVGGEASYWGILGIVVVLGAGLLLMLRVGDPAGRITDLD